MAPPARGRVEIALATQVAAPAATHDDSLLVEPLARRLSARVVAVPWDAPDVDWGRFAAVVVRSTWNYHLHVSAFTDWADHVEAAGATLCNPATVVRWNADKRYLLDLEAAGIAIVPTELVGRGKGGRWADTADTGTDTDTDTDTKTSDRSLFRLREILDRRGWGTAVVKPTISATSYRTWITHAGDMNGDGVQLDVLLADADAMVQPLMPEVKREGEWSFMFLVAPGGVLEYSHCVLKRPADHDFRVQPEFGGTVSPATPSRALLRQVRDVAALLSERAPAPLLYARCDGIVSDGTWAPAGRLLLMEAELIEPHLFLREASGAADRFADGLAWLLARDRQPA